jgi:subtilisin family serine protease
MKNMTANFKRFLLSFSSMILMMSGAWAQGNSEKKSAPSGWHTLDRTESGFYGISLDKAYQFLKNQPSKTITVAVIDSGIDTTHEDLKPILWVNKDEIPGNGIDDDKNGYIDDVNGWNFIGGKDGRNVKQDSYEGARVYWKLREKYGEEIPDTTSMSEVEKSEVREYIRATEKTIGASDPKELFFMKRILPNLEKGDSIIAKDLGKTEFTGKDLKSYVSSDVDAKTAASIYLNIAKLNDNYDISNEDILNDLRGQIRKAEAASTPPGNYRAGIVQDDEGDITDRYYGNNDIMANTPMHGTHCAGIIGAQRGNNIGMDGIADNVRIMMVRAVPDGDEHDKDIANAIRYAVDNGAQIVSMSFGKDFSPEKNWVDDAVKYAASKNVLLVHAAGNDHKNVDSLENFPNPIFLDNTGQAANFITVGASGDPTNGGVTASFSNYGKAEVDVFAPGVNIYSTLPGGNKYGNLSGTSMACPVVAGVAALLLSHYPTLTAEQLKYVIEKSATPLKEKVKLPGTDDMVSLADISKTGGQVNAFEAVKLAASLSGDRTDKKDILPKSKAKRKAD